MASSKRTTKSKSNTGETIGVVFLIIITLGIALFFITRKRKPVEEVKDVTVNVNTVSTPVAKVAKVVRNDNFPLQFGSLGPKVKQLQQALISKFGTAILPKFGADQDFGSETRAALASKGLKIVLDESDFNAIVNNSTLPVTSVTTTAIDYRKDAARLKTAFEDIAGTDNDTVRDLLKPSRNSNYLKQLRDTYDKNYGGAGSLIKRLKLEQDFTEFTDIINNLETL